VPPNFEPKKAPAIDAQLAQQLAKHKGRWVAVDDSTNAIVGSGASAAEAVETARQKGITDPLVFRVPLHARRVRMR
jgi:hypothetical protein